MEDMNKAIKQYEPMMHRLLRRFQVKKDYEDIMQLLRWKMWEILRDKKYNKLYKNKKGVITNAKKVTFIYKVLSSRLQNILRVDYKLIIKDIGIAAVDLPIASKLPYYMENPGYFAELSPQAQLNCIIDLNTAKNIKCKLDFELFYNSLSSSDQELLNLMSKDNDKAAITKKLKCTKRTINRRLKILKNQFKEYLIKGGL